MHKQVLEMVIKQCRENASSDCPDRRYLTMAMLEDAVAELSAIINRGTNVDEMVNRFLGWRLPDDFCPDAGISFEPEYNVEYMAAQGKPPCRHEPIGTNLLNADQARQMVLHLLGNQAELFTLLEANIEKLVFGERFEHWLDPFFIGCFIEYSAYAVYACAVHNSNQ